MSEHHSPRADNNPYEAAANDPAAEAIMRAEADRLGEAESEINQASNRLSIMMAGDVGPHHEFLDVGAGENTGLRDHYRAPAIDAMYTALDVRPEAVARRQETDDIRSRSIVMDIREGLHLPDASMHVVHARYVSAYFEGGMPTKPEAYDDDPSAPDEPRDRQRLFEELYRVTAPGGRMVVIDYDWSRARGSWAVEQLRNMGIDYISRFDADLGRTLGQELQRQFHGRGAQVITQRHDFPHTTDYTPLLKLRPIITQGLLLEPNGAELSQAAAELFDHIQAEANSPNPPGYAFPSAVGVAVLKPGRWGMQ